MARLFILTMTLIVAGINLTGQHVYYQDIINGGVAGGGGNTAAGAGTFSFTIDIPFGSTVKKAYLIIGRDGSPNDIIITLNGINYLLDESSITTTGFLSSYTTPPPSSVICMDVTTDIDPAIINYELTVPTQKPITQQAYRPFYLFIVYENPLLTSTAISLVLNEVDVAAQINYQLFNIAPIDNAQDVGFAFVGKHFCNITTDGSYVYVNQNNLGLVGGSDYNSSWNCSGTQGHFSYHSNTLFGSGDDTPDSIMGGPDALADIKDYVSNNETFIDINFVYQTPNWEEGSLSNPIVAAFLAYTTPCQPFETTLTEEVAICRGASAQLQATGGTSTGSVPGYEWLPQEDLTCYDCPNPVFVGDSTRHYTVRIWNTDSCSKVLPVKVLVRDVPTQANLYLNPATCSESNGSLSISNVVGGTPLYIYNIGGNNTTNPNFNNLAPGVYNLQITDANTCTYNQAFTIEETNPVTADFTANPQQGVAPLNVNFTNQSAGANLYQWLVNTQTFESFNFNYTFDTAGTYPVQLIASYNEPLCADTAQKVVVVENDFSVIIPTFFHSSQGTWSITTSNVVQIKAQVYNTIGQLVHQTEQTANNGPNPIWPVNENATGYYFYRLQITDVEGKEFDYTGKVLLVN